MSKLGLNVTEKTTKSITELDVLSIDNRIQKKIEIERQKLDEYQEQLSTIKETLKLKDLSLRVTNSLQNQEKILSEKIAKIENDTELNLYIAKTDYFIQEYKRLLKVPVKMSFMGKPVKDDSDKQNIIQQYLTVAIPYIDDEIHIEHKQNNKTNCPDCGGTEFEIEDGNVYICTECFTQQIYSNSTSSYNDTERVNVTSKYLYERKVHFRDCLKQYQGKQNCTIPQEVYDGLEEQFRLHHLLVGDENTPRKERFKNITKLHIMTFLKNPLGYTKHYENVHLIHYMFTGIKPVNLSHLEGVLLDDFDILAEKYTEKDISRKNFINTHYVLYQLLRRHKFPCKPYDFPELKTPDRKCFHDEICRELFEELGWNHSPYY